MACTLQRTLLPPGRPTRSLGAALVALVGMTLAAAACRAAVPGYEFVAPKVGARLITIQHNVIIRQGAPIDPATISSSLLQVSGSSSGAHAGLLQLSDDGRTLIWSPLSNYLPDETVTVTLSAGIQTTSAAPLPPFTFQFTTSPQTGTTAARGGIGAAAAPAPDARPADAGTPTTLASCPALPTRYPTASVLYSNNPDASAGPIFLSPFLMASSPSASGHLLIVDNRANPIYWRSLVNTRPDGFTLQPNGRLSYVGTTMAFFLDSTYAAVDSVAPGNGYPIDGHVFKVLPNGHMLCQSYDAEPYPMDTVVAGGQPDAVVQGLVLQELDLARRVVFEWRSWDYFQVTDCVASAGDLTGVAPDAVHGNALDVDPDGNWLLSSRHLNEITKINRTTGDIIWRMGPNAKNNQFTFLNDTRGFAGQHDVRRLPNGHITMFDNGNDLNPTFSRGVEYAVDEVNKTAQLVWQYRTNPDTFGGFMGDVQRRSDGSTLIGWGGNQTTLLRVSDLHPDGSRALEIGLKSRTYSYEALRFPWHTSLMATYPSELEFGPATPHGQLQPIRHSIVRNESNRSVTIACSMVTNPVFTLLTPLPATLGPGDSLDVTVAFDSTQYNVFHDRLYLRATNDSEVVAAPIDLDVSALPGVGVDDARDVRGFALHVAGANPFHAGTSLVYDLPRAAFVTLEVYDVRGRRVESLMSRLENPGRHAVSWAPRALADGVYFARLHAGGFEAVEKLIRIR